MTLGSGSDSRTDVKAARNSTAAINLSLGILGAIGGAVVGHYVYYWIATQGLLAIALPGAMTGLGCAALSGRRSIPLGIISAILALLAGIYSEWRIAPFRADGSLSYFLANLLNITLLGKITIILGTVVAYRFGTGREGGCWPRQRERLRG